MVFPYGSDRDDGFIGYASIAIVALCVLVFGATWPRETQMVEDITRDSVKVWAREDADARMNALRESVEGKTPAAALDSAGNPLSTSAGPDSSTPHVDAPAAGVPSSSDPFGEFTASRRMQKRIDDAVRERSPLRSWGLHPGDANWLPALFTHMFLHAGWGHLIGNMIFFFAFGVAMERRFGLKGFLFLYLVGGVFAALCEVGAHDALHHGLPKTPLVGASGAIAATMGAFLRSYPKAKIKIFAWVWRPQFGMVPAWLFLGGWFVVQFVYNQFLSPLQEGGTAYAAHVAGFAFGFLAAQFLPVDPEIVEHQKSLEAGREKAIHGALVGLAYTGTPEPKRVELPPVDQAWDAFRYGDETRARQLLTRQFGEWIKGSDADLAKLVEQVEKVLRIHPLFHFDPLPSWEWGMRLAQTSHAGAAAELLRMALEGDPPVSPAMASRAEQALAVLKATLRTPATPMAAAVPSPPAPPFHASVPPPRPTAAPGSPGERNPSTGPDGRPSWMVD